MQEVKGLNRTISAGFTRPNDTTAYAAGDVVSNSTSAPTIMIFPRATSQAGGNGIIQQAILVTSASVATKPDLELWLFDTTVTMDNDNAAFTPTDAEMLTLVGVIRFPTSSFVVGTATAGAGGNAACDVQNLGIPINTKNGDNSLYGILVVRNAYVPVAEEVFTVRIKVLD
jgi:hypothetical protein